MAEPSLTRYAAGDRSRWDAFVRRSKNGTFLFCRDYMEYHADRFVDHSLLVEVDGELVGLLPANVDGDRLLSHGGLTYGGVVSDERMTAERMLHVFDALRAYLRAQGFASLLYKTIPHVYHRQPAEEDLYALFRSDAVLTRRDLSSSIFLADRLPLRKGRRWAVSRAAKNDLTVGPDDDFEGFMELEARLLADKHGTRPVHSGEEMRRLATAFPREIRLYTARLGGELLAGTIIYDTPVAAHAQYIGSTERGRELFAQDALFSWLLDVELAERRWFDFGISTVAQGRELNERLADNKESWGARTTVHDFYELRP